jgi:hypothetical protein
MDRRNSIRGEATGAADQMAAIGELRNHATHGGLFERICTGLFLSGITEAGIVAGLPKATTGSVHGYVENTRKAATRLARRGDHIPAEDE